MKDEFKIYNVLTYIAEKENKLFNKDKQFILAILANKTPDVKHAYSFLDLSPLNSISDYYHYNPLYLPDNLWVMNELNLDTLYIEELPKNLKVGEIVFNMQYVTSPWELFYESDGYTSRDDIKVAHHIYVYSYDHYKGDDTSDIVEKFPDPFQDKVAVIESKRRRY